VAASLTFAAPASAYCRSTTVPVSANFMPSATTCWTEGAPLYWASSCVSYMIHSAASTQVSTDATIQILAQAFAAWTAPICTGAGADAGKQSASIVPLFGGLTTDGTVGYVSPRSTPSNKNLIRYRDDAWLHTDSSNTLGLTTLTYDVDTGEVYDADMEINSHDHVLYSGDAAHVPTDGYDLRTILTHEVGHFLGLAHSGDRDATMFASYKPGSTTQSTLTSDDAAGLCEAYRPSGERSVLGGTLKPASACAAGATSGCDGSMSGGCSLETAAPPSLASLACVGAVATLGLRLRRRKRAASRSTPS